MTLQTEAKIAWCRTHGIYARVGYHGLWCDDKGGFHKPEDGCILEAWTPPPAKVTDNQDDTFYVQTFGVSGLLLRAVVNETEDLTSIAIVSASNPDQIFHVTAIPKQDLARTTPQEIIGAMTIPDQVRLGIDQPSVVSRLIEVLGRKLEEIIKPWKAIAWKWGGPRMVEDVHTRFQNWVPAVDTEVLDVILASACDCKIPGDPIWLYLIAPPGGFKTEIIHALRGWNIQFIDKLTRNTLISGYESKAGVKVRGIMPKLDGKVLLIRDFTLLLEMDRRERNEIFAQLRVAYDGELTYGYGVLPEPVTVKASFGLIAAVTPVIDIYTTVQSLLGERFLKIRTEQDRADSVERSRRNQGSEIQMRHELNEATLAFLKNVTFDRIPELTDEQNKSVDAIAEFVALARTVVRYWVPEGGGAPQTDLEPCPEYATRVVKQLVKLLRLLAIIRQHDAVMEEDLTTIRRIACDTVIPRRIKVLANLYFGGASDETEIVESTAMPRKPIRSALEELELINLIRQDSQGNHDLTSQFRQTMEIAFNTPKMASEQSVLAPTVGNLSHPYSNTPIETTDLTHGRGQTQGLPLPNPDSGREIVLKCLRSGGPYHDWTGLTNQVVMQGGLERDLASLHLNHLVRDGFLGLDPDGSWRLIREA